MTAEEEIEVEAPAPLMNLEEEVHNHNSGNENEVQDEMSTIELPDDDDEGAEGVYDASSSSWTKKKKYATAALALTSVAILAIAIGAPTNAQNNSNTNAVTSAMNLENCLAIMKKLELDDNDGSTPEPSTYQPTTYIPSKDPTDPPVLTLSNDVDVSDYLIEAVQVGSSDDGQRELRGAGRSKHMPEKEARVSGCRVYVCTFCFCLISISYIMHFQLLNAYHQ